MLVSFVTLAFMLVYVCWVGALMFVGLGPLICLLGLAYYCMVYGIVEEFTKLYAYNFKLKCFRCFR